MDYTPFMPASSRKRSLRKPPESEPLRYKRKLLQRQSPSSTLILFRAARERKIDYIKLARELSGALKKPVIPSGANQLLGRFKVAWRARELQNRGLNESEIASRMNLNRVTISLALTDRRYGLPPRAPRKSIQEMAKILGKTEAEIKKMLEWKPER